MKHTLELHDEKPLKWPEDRPRIRFQDRAPQAAKKELEKVNVEFYNLPENKKPNFRLPLLHLSKLAVKEVSNSEGDVSQVLSFETIYPWDS